MGKQQEDQQKYGWKTPGKHVKQAFDSVDDEERGHTSSAKMFLDDSKALMM